MILYFSGTGNSRYIAKRIADRLHDDLLNANEYIRKNNTHAIGAQSRLIIVAPTYAWRIPRILRDWILNTEFPSAVPTWFVMDCGSEIGNAAKYNRRLCDQKGFIYMGTAQIVMPENYIALFNTPEPEEARRIVARAEPAIDAAIQAIAAGRAFPAPRRNLCDRLLSGPVNALFYPLFVNARAFRADERCIGCGKCASLCPLNNIVLKNGKPVWGEKCTHCMACIAYCPARAIEYGKRSAQKYRYTFEGCCGKMETGGKHAESSGI